ncbi:DUF1579 domain-containing protein [Roseibium sp. M-1]
MDQTTSGTRPADDFNFMFGRWTVRHRRLKERLSGLDDWDHFDGTSETRPILGGLGNVEDNFLDLPDGGYRAVALRSFDGGSNLWSIWWLDGRAPQALDTPVRGGFDGETGEFFADDSLEGRVIKVRFRWLRGGKPRWEQAFSEDDGVSWETNWIMEFTRAA